VLGRIVLLMVDAHDKGGDFLVLGLALGRGGDDHLLGSRLQVSESLLVGEEAGGFYDILYAQFCPGEVLQFFFRHDAGDLVAVYDKDIVFGLGRIAFSGTEPRLHLALYRIVLELVGEVSGIGGDIDHGYDVNLILAQKPLVDDGLEHQPSDPSETIDSYFHGVPPWEQSRLLEGGLRAA